MQIKQKKEESHSYRIAAAANGKLLRQMAGNIRGSLKELYELQREITKRKGEEDEDKDKSKASDTE